MPYEKIGKAGEMEVWSTALPLAGEVDCNVMIEAEGGKEFVLTLSQARELYNLLSEAIESAKRLRVGKFWEL